LVRRRLRLWLTVALLCVSCKRVDPPGGTDAPSAGANASPHAGGETGSRAPFAIVTGTRTSGSLSSIRSRSASFNVARMRLGPARR
jgi:hypothetical protein